ncbi:MAG: hypothetical protein H7A30_04525 [Thermotogae bacterium]|nr:hypothetical protein [Thermotogota bacterium]
MTFENFFSAISSYSVLFIYFTITGLFYFFMRPEEKGKKLNFYYISILIYSFIFMLIYDDSFFILAAAVLFIINITTYFLKKFIKNDYSAEIKKNIFNIAGFIFQIIFIYILYFGYSRNIYSTYYFNYIESVLFFVFIFLLFCFKSSDFIKNILIYIYKGKIPEFSDDSGVSTGKYIGMLERFLIMLFVLIGKPEALAIIFTAKSITRFKELENKKFAEYYLIGTLLSNITGIIGGYILVLF